MTRKSTVKATLLVSAPTLDAMTDAVKEFYCGTACTLVGIGNSTWQLMRNSAKKILERVGVIEKKGRYRIEMLDA